MRVFLILLLVIMVPAAHAQCGLAGTITDRLRDCSQKSANVPGFEVVSVTSDGSYLYHRGQDLIISPPLKRSEKKCLRPYKRITAVSRFLRLVPKHGDTPTGSARCVLREASRYVLLDGEKFL